MCEFSTFLNGHKPPIHVSTEVKSLPYFVFCDQYAVHVSASVTSGQKTLLRKAPAEISNGGRKGLNLDLSKGCLVLVADRLELKLISCL